MQLKEFICKSCSSKSTKGSSFHKLCYLCNNKRLLNSKPKLKITNSVKKPKSYECKNCGCQTSQGNSFHKLCVKCNQSRLDNKPKSRVKKKPKIYRKKVTGEREMFSMIWDTRPHICTNCDESLGVEARVHYFSHIKPKGKYPELRLDPNNIKLLCIECHRKLDFGGL